MKSVSDTYVIRWFVPWPTPSTTFKFKDVRRSDPEWPHIELMMENKIAMANSLMDVVKAAMARRQKK